MDVSRHIQVVSDEGLSLVRAAEAAGLGAKVPTCPDWEVRDLVRHTGMVHRWATAFMAERRTEFRLGGGLPELDGAELLDWFREGHAALVDTLTGTPPDAECWTFLPAPSPLAFWARRQAHETTVHRTDAESACGDTVSPIDAEFAVDGIEELLLGMHSREKSRVRTEKPRVLRVRATDAPAEWTWTVRLSAGPPVTERGATAAADCEVSGQAAGLYLALWNRLPFPEVSGDPALAALWRERSAIVMR